MRKSVGIIEILVAMALTFVAARAQGQRGDANQLFLSGEDSTAKDKSNKITPRYHLQLFTGASYSYSRTLHKVLEKYQESGDLAARSASVSYYPGFTNGIAFFQSLPFGDGKNSLSFQRGIEVLSVRSTIKTNMTLSEHTDPYEISQNKDVGEVTIDAVQTGLALSLNLKWEDKETGYNISIGGQLTDNFSMIQNVKEEGTRIRNGQTIDARTQYHKRHFATSGFILFYYDEPLRGSLLLEVGKRGIFSKEHWKVFARLRHTMTPQSFASGRYINSRSDLSNNAARTGLQALDSELKQLYAKEANVPYTDIWTISLLVGVEYCW